MAKRKQEELVSETLDLIEVLSGYKLENYLNTKVQKLKNNIESIISVENEDNKFILAREGIVRSINHISTSLQDIFKITEDAKKEISYCDNAINDILHAIEIIDSSDSKIIHYGEEVKRLRKRRRNAKDFIDTTHHFRNFASGDKNRGAIGRIYNLKKSTNDKDKLLEKRTYTVKVLKDMQKDFDKNQLVSIKNNHSN